MQTLIPAEIARTDRGFTTSRGEIACGRIVYRRISCGEISCNEISYREISCNEETSRKEVSCNDSSCREVPCNERTVAPAYPVARTTGARPARVGWGHVRYPSPVRPSPLVREKPLPYGSAPTSEAPRAETPIDIANRLLASWSCIVKAENWSVLVEGDTLRLALETRAYRRMGYSSFHDFALEAAELTSSTAKRRVALSRTATDVPKLREALQEGRLSPCQALALRGVLTAETAEPWISLAENRDLSQIESIVRRARQESVAGHAMNGSAKDLRDSTSESDSVRGGHVSFPAPTSARLAFEEGIELARQVLGYDAPHHACVAAMLAEASSTGWASCVGDASEIDGPATDSRDERIRRGLRDEIHRSPRHRARGGEQFQGGTHGDGEPRPGTSPHDPASTRVPATDGDAQAGHATRATAQVASLSPLQKAMTRAKATARNAAIEVDEFAQLLEESLTRPSDANPWTLVERLEEVRAAAAPLRVLRLHVLRDLIDLDAPRRLGYRSLAAFATDRLHLAERTFRDLLRDAEQLELRPDIERALLSAEVGSSKLRLLATVDRHRLSGFLARARDITFRQLAREVRIHEKLRTLRAQLSLEEWNRACSVHHDSETRSVLRRGSQSATRAGSRPIFVFPDRMLGPLPQPGLERALRRVLLQHGWSAEALERELAGLDPSLRGPVERVKEPDADAEHSELEAVPASGPIAPEDEIQRLLRADPAASPGLMRRIELLLNLALLAVCPDSLRVPGDVHATGRQTLNPDAPMTRIRFWAPDAVREDLGRYFKAIRSKLGTLPDWAAFSLLLRDAMRAWRTVDPKSRPRRWRVLERDVYHCQAPGCSSRRGLEVHHVQFRSHGGSDCSWNLITLCHVHHRHGAHEGWVRALGDASAGLEWSLGPPGRQRLFLGDLRIRPRS